MAKLKGVRQRGNSYMVDCTIDGKRKTKTFKSVEDAITFRNKYVEAVQSGGDVAAVQAEVARGKAAGLSHETKTIMHGKIDQLSADEVRKELESIANQINPKIIEGKAEEIINKRQIKRNEKEKQTASSEDA